MTGEGFELTLEGVGKEYGRGHHRIVAVQPLGVKRAAERPPGEAQSSLWTTTGRFIAATYIDFDRAGQPLAPPPPAVVTSGSPGGLISDGDKILAYAKTPGWPLMAVIEIDKPGIRAVSAQEIPRSILVLCVLLFGVGALVSVGAVIAGWVATPLVRRVGTRGAVIGAGVVQAAAWVVIALTGTPWIASAGFVLLGAASTLVTVAVVSARQQAVPNHLLGRVVSAFRLIGNGVAPLGSVAGGLIASAAGFQAPLLAAPVLLVAAMTVLGILLARAPR